jgi:hypothetical protein
MGNHPEILALEVAFFEVWMLIQFMAMNGQELNDFFKHQTWRYPIADMVPKRSMVCNGEMIRKGSRDMCLLKACRH